MAAAIKTRDNRNWRVGSAGSYFAGPKNVCVTEKRVKNPYDPDVSARKKKKIAPTICIELLCFLPKRLPRPAL